MSFFKKIGEGIKKVAKKVGGVVKKVGKYALPIAGAALPFIPGVGSAMGGIVSKVGGLFGGSSAQSNAPPSGNPNQVNITGQRPGFDWGKAIGDIAPVALGGAMNYFGQRQQNVANAQQAQAQMDFQAQQTSSAYQRGTEDMKAAGLNPMLAYSQGGAASGGGAQASMGNELGAGANSAMSVAMARQQMQQSQAQIENINADTGNKDQQTTNLQSENLYTLARTATEGGRQHHLAQDVARIALENQLKAATQSYSISSAKSGADARESEAQGLRLGLKEKEAWSRFYGSAVGKAYPYVSKATEQSNSAANVFRKFIPFTND